MKSFGAFSVLLGLTTLAFSGIARAEFVPLTDNEIILNTDPGAGCSLTKNGQTYGYADTVRLVVKLGNKVIKLYSTSDHIFYASTSKKPRDLTYFDINNAARARLTQKKAGNRFDMQAIGTEEPMRVTDLVVDCKS